MTNVTTPLHHERLQNVLDVLLDLANDGKNCWRQITDKQTERIARLKETSKTQLDRPIDQPQSNWLRDALIVKWEDSEDENWLLVTSSWYERADPEMRVGSFNAIRHCLLLYKQIQYTGDQTTDLFILLDELGLLEDSTDTKVHHLGYRRFRINFSSCPSRERKACKAHVEKRWLDAFPPKQKRPTDARPRSKDPEARLNRRLADLVSPYKAAVEAKLMQRRQEGKKHLYVPLKVKILRPDAPDGEGTVCVPEPADLRGAVEGKGGQLLLIWEEGGAGKTSLAFEIAQWAVRGRFGGLELLPFFWEPLGDPANELALGQRVAKYLNTLSDSSIAPEEVDELLRHKRLLLIADHFSELTDEQRRWLERELPDKCLVLLTSRLREHGQRLATTRGFTLTEIQPQRLKEEELFRFFREYLDQRGVEEGKGGRDPWLAPDDFMETQSLLERMVGNQPITVLLAWMVIEQAIQHIRARKDDSNPGVKDLLPNSVPALMEEYVKRSVRAIETPNRFFHGHPEQEPQWILVLMKALALEAHRQKGRYQPQNFPASLADDAWADVLLDDQPLKAAEQQRLLAYMKDNLTLLSGKAPDHGEAMYRIALDPLADYLAALAQRDLWEKRPDHRAEVERWLCEQIGRRETADEGPLDPLAGMRGFLAACRDSYRPWLNRFGSSLDSGERGAWDRLLDLFAREAKIDQAGERILAAKNLIRRHAKDLEWANPKLRGEAIAGLTAFAQELKPPPAATNAACEGVPELAVAVAPLVLTMHETDYPSADRAAAAEALGHIGGEKAATALIQMIESSEDREVAVRRAAAEALGLVEAPGDDPEAHWSLLEGILAEPANHLHGDSFEAMDAKLPLLQGAARGLQRLAARKNIPTWGSEEGLKVPMLTLTATAGAVTTRVVEDVEVWQLPLPGEVPLEVVKIPDGTYTIGSPPPEVGRLAYPLVPENQREEVEALREVTLDLTSSHGAPFAMARFPITQSQWRTLAGPEHRREGDAELQSDPSQHKGGDLPVENVSWFACQEWIKRLNRWLKDERKMGPAEEPLRLALPPESLWEVACRAGSASPFHFGDTLDASWANHDASVSPYATGRLGRYLQRPSPVGAYGLVNSLGLGDLHGNVWEWCADLYHPSPCGGPHDGLPWMELLDGIPVQEQRVLLRGGSWFNAPLLCRSAYRFGDPPANLSDLVGFRVCCLPPGLPSWSFNP